MDEELKETLDQFKKRLDSMDGTMNNYHTLLTNHITDFTTRFGRLKVSVENSIENSKERDKALHTKIDAFKWSLVLVATFTVISLGGFIALAMWVISKLMGG